MKLIILEVTQTAMRSHLLTGSPLLLLLSLVTFATQAYGQAPDLFNRTLMVSGAVTLDATLSRGNLTIMEGRDDRVVITAWVRNIRSQPDNPARLPLAVEQDGSHIRLSYVNDPAVKEPAKLDIAVRIEAPHKTEVTSSIGKGDLTMVGIDGPVKAVTTTGNTSISYTLNHVSAQLGTGDLEIEAVSGRVRAVVSNGNISCTRVPEGVSVEVGEGDINLRVVGPSEARVRKGGGRIYIGGAKSTLVAVTDNGDLHVKAVPHRDWQLSSGSGNIRLELPPTAGFEIDAVTKTGRISVKRQDFDTAATNELMQKVNGGGTRIQVRSETGNIVIN
jgi:hypothetical protein